MSARTVVQIRLSEVEKAQWIKQAGSRSLSDYLRFLVQQDTDTPDTPSDPGRLVAVNVSSPDNDLSSFGGAFFKSVPAPKKGRR